LPGRSEGRDLATAESDFKPIQHGKSATSATFRLAIRPVRSAPGRIAERYSRFVESGLAPDLSLIIAVHPNVEVPRTSRNADRPLDSAA
jgi:hypothetical protein